MHADPWDLINQHFRTKIFYDFNSKGKQILFHRNQYCLFFMQLKFHHLLLLYQKAGFFRSIQIFGNLGFITSFLLTTNCSIILQRNMANRTDPRAQQIHGTNPQFLIDKIVRLKIHNDPYFKEKCFALTAETLVDRAIELKYIGGTFGGNRRPCKFLCLILKMLQIQPEDDIVLEFIKNKDYKYIRALGAFYWRLVGRAKDIYTVLEPLYSDYRRLVVRKESGKFEEIHMDELVDELLRQDVYCDVTLPRISKRHVLEEEGMLEPYVSALNIQDDDALGNQTENDVEEQKVGATELKSSSRSSSSSSSGSSYSSSSRSEDSREYRKRKQKEADKRKESKYKAPEPPKEGSDEYWMELRKKIGMK